MDVDALLEEAARDVEKTREQHVTDEARDSEPRKDDRRDRHSDRRDRSRDRGDRRGDRRRSRDRDHRRRDDSRPRSNRGDDDRYRRSSSRDRYRGGRRDRGGDYYSGGGRARSRSPRGDRPRRERERSGDRKVSRREKTPSPEVTEDDRDKRTIFVQQISQRAETRHLRTFFEVIGPVVEAQIVKDRVTGRSKGQVKSGMHRNTYANRLLALVTLSSRMKNLCPRLWS